MRILLVLLILSSFSFGQSDVVYTDDYVVIRGGRAYWKKGMSLFSGYYQCFEDGYEIDGERRYKIKALYENGIVIKKWFENGNLHYDSSPDFKRMWWYNGQLMYEENYKDGYVSDEKVVHYWADGTIDFTIYYVNGVWDRCEGNCD